MRESYEELVETAQTIVEGDKKHREILEKFVELRVLGGRKVIALVWDHFDGSIAYYDVRPGVGEPQWNWIMGESLESIEVLGVWKP